jgi:hypothetical protein
MSVFENWKMTIFAGAVYRAWQGGVWRGKHVQLRSVHVFVAAGCLSLT